MAEVAAGGQDASQRTRSLLEAARRTRGFMPDDEGEALYQAALRAGEARVPGAVPPTFVEIGAWCGKSTVYLGAAAEATGAVRALHRPPQGLGGEPTRVGVPRARSGGRRRRADRHAAPLASHHFETGLEASVVGIVGDSPTMAARWDRPLSFCFIDGGHGEEPGLGGLSGMVAPRRASGAGWPSTTCFPTQPTGAARHTSSIAPQWTRTSSWMTAPAAACGCCDGYDPRGRSSSDRPSPVGTARASGGWSGR